jgi:hypothetical protein
MGWTEAADLIIASMEKAIVPARDLRLRPPDGQRVPGLCSASVR